MEESAPKLLVWCQKRTLGYERVHVRDFSVKSWQDGLAFLALLHSFSPKNLPFEFKRTLNNSPEENLNLAFSIATKLGIPSGIVKVSDFLEERVETNTLVQYLLYWYQYFTKEVQKNTGHEKPVDSTEWLKKVELMKEKRDQKRKDYETRMAQQTGLQICKRCKREFKGAFCEWCGTLKRETSVIHHTGELAPSAQEEEERLQKQKAEQLEKAQRARQDQIEKQKRAEVEKQKQKQEELEKQAEEKQRQTQLEKQKQEELEKQKQVEAEKQKQEELERQKQLQLEKQKQEELEKQKQLEAEKQKQEELERQKQIELEKQRKEQAEKEELEKQRQAQLEKQKQEELERQKQIQLEKQKQEESEKQKLLELEKQKQEESEKQKHTEVDKQKKAEEEKKQKEEQKKLQALKEEEEKRQLEAEWNMLVNGQKTANSQGKPPPRANPPDQKRLEQLKPDEDGPDYLYYLARALLDFEAEDTSQISFQKNDILEIYERDDSGWWLGKFNGKIGWVPSDFFELLDGGFAEDEQKPPKEKEEAEVQESPKPASPENSHRSLHGSMKKSSADLQKLLDEIDTENKSHQESEEKNDSIQKEGYLLKLEGEKKWKKFWFRLQGTKVLYFKSKPSKSTPPVGMIPVPFITTIEAVEDPNQKKNKPIFELSFFVEQVETTFFLQSNNEESVKEWIAVHGISVLLARAAC